MKDIGLKINNQDKVKNGLLMVQYMRANIKRGKDMDKGK